MRLGMSRLRVAKDGDWPGLAAIGREAVGWAVGWGTGMGAATHGIGAVTPAPAPARLAWGLIAPAASRAGPRPCAWAGTGGPGTARSARRWPHRGRRSRR